MFRSPSFVRARRVGGSLLMAAAIAVAPLTASAHRGGPSAAPSELSTASGVSVGVVMAAPVLVLSGGAVLAVAAIDTLADGTVWVLERASDGARTSVKFSAAAAGGLSVAVGAAVTVTAVSAGWLLSAAGQVVAFVPNQIGQALLHNERLTR